jgi:hypothetical protein
VLAWKAVLARRQGKKYQQHCPNKCGGCRGRTQRKAETEAFERKGSRQERAKRRSWMKMSAQVSSPRRGNVIIPFTAGMQMEVTADGHCL